MSKLILKVKFIFALVGVISFLIFAVPTTVSADSHVTRFLNDFNKKVRSARKLKVQEQYIQQRTQQITVDSPPLIVAAPTLSPLMNNVHIGHLTTSRGIIRNKCFSNPGRGGFRAHSGRDCPRGYIFKHIDQTVARFVGGTQVELIYRTSERDLEAIRRCVGIKKDGSYTRVGLCSDLLR